MAINNCWKSNLLLMLMIQLITTTHTNAWKCGHKFEVNDRIIGGTDVGYLKYPWFAGLNEDGYYSCGGTLIAPRYVVTAAHCFSEAKNNDDLRETFKVTLGLYNRCKDESTQRSYNIKEVFIHEKYTKEQPFYDIALLLLDGNTDEFMPSCISQVGTDKTKRRRATIVGLGTLEYLKSQQPCTLREASVALHSDEVCVDMLTKILGIGDRFKKAFCAGYLEGGIDSCQGDSGGPLMILGDKGEHILLGITSFGYGCGFKDSLGVYTDVAHYIDWLNDKMMVNLTNGSPL